jgi:hypothetical protein
MTESGFSMSGAIVTVVHFGKLGLTMLYTVRVTNTVCGARNTHEDVRSYE